MTKPKSGLVDTLSPWVGRWGVYWRIQKLGEYAPLAEELAAKYPWTWELRLVLKHRANENKGTNMAYTFPLSQKRSDVPSTHSTYHEDRRDCG